ncbi:BAD isoform 3 [Pan troglodytes]|uniref:BCL2 associated agonist of cell death n=4 Tax=Homininae TaxID=207598 RepID=A8MXU7_HUMAN|nr:BCL2 associated agonist of cell death [Homo sapiens]KAI4072011.1 BCL2 associated agonist of cell death [Homo sapiens]PNI94102.1 BAD isoform 3 [Pan troglodytes]
MFQIPEFEPSEQEDSSSAERGLGPSPAGDGPSGSGKHHRQAPGLLWDASHQQEQPTSSSHHGGRTSYSPSWESEDSENPSAGMLAEASAGMSAPAADSEAQHAENVKLEALGLWRSGVATAPTPRGRRTTKGWGRSPAPFGAARARRPPTSGQHSAMAASSGG